MMVSRVVYMVFFISYVANELVASASTDLPITREEKHFSLFSVVTFKNEECTSETTLTGGARAGTCYTTSECSDKGGTKSGNCASGFGVCCVFINKAATTATIKENRTHLRNAEYPSYATATASTTIVYTINKMQSDICQIRLDFTTFLIAGPSDSQSKIACATQNHHCTNDQIQIATTGNTGLYPMLCGALTGSHIYIELSPTAADAATLTLKTSLTTANQPTPAIAARVWDFKTSQIPCYATYRAPSGCHQYLMTDTGKITSANFYMVKSSTRGGSTAQNTGLQLASQFTNTCIRRSKGMCCVQYNVCVLDSQGIALVDETGPNADTGVEGTYSEGFSVDTNLTPWISDDYADNGLFDGACSSDYVEVPSSHTGTCGGGKGSTGGSAVNSRYCGSKFGANIEYNTADVTSFSSAGVCDCSEPFMVRHGTDCVSDVGGFSGVNVVNVNLTVAPRGFCFDFVQRPCYH